MWTFGAAIFAAVISFILKMVLDIRAEHQARRALAAALAGELGSYMRLSAPEQSALHIKALAEAEPALRAMLLPGLFAALPIGHPVFDRSADRIGDLSPEAARGVSEAYNIITSARLFLTMISSEAFVKAPDAVQIARISTMADRFAQEIPGMRETVTLLNTHARQSFWNHLRGRVQ